MLHHSVIPDCIAHLLVAGVPPADLYILGRILHDWEQPRCERLLRLLRSRVRPGGAVLLAEMLLPDQASSTGDCSTGSGTGDAGPGDGDATDEINGCLGSMQRVVSQAAGSSWDDKGVSAVLQGAAGYRALQLTLGMLNCFFNPAGQAREDIPSPTIVR